MNGLNIPQPWEFNREVAQQFERHVRQSIPSYEEILRLFARVVSEWRHGPLEVLDLGCGTGEALRALSSVFLPGDTARGIDSSAEMLERARCTSYGIVLPEFVMADLRDYEPSDFDVAAVTFTLSFLPSESREILLRKLRNACSGSAILFLADKITYSRKLATDVISSDHRAKKLLAGLTSDEVRDKARSLVGVQDPWMLGGYLTALKSAGWRDCQVLHLQTGFFACVAFSESEMPQRLMD